MNRIILSLLAIFLSTQASAQLSGDGYYRVQNLQSSRYIYMIDNKTTGFSYQKTSYDVGALRTISPFSRVVNDPGSVFYISKVNGNQYNLRSQGADAHNMVGRYLTLTSTTYQGKTYYRASATEQGITLYLFDEDYSGPEGVISTQKTGSVALMCWDLQPVSASADNYFGLNSTVQVGSQHFTTLYASFPFTHASENMKNYVVTKIDGEFAVWKEVTGKVAASTPVIMQLSGATATDNRLNLEVSGGNAPSDNILKGVYFENSTVDMISPSSFHFNATPYDPNTMRLLGVTSKGKLGFVKSDVQYIPRNQAYLVVPAGSPNELTLLSQAEYEAELANDVVTVTARDKQRQYGDANPTFDYDVTGTGTLKGQPTITCSATPSSPVGTYPIVVGKGSVTNRQFTPVNGTLTVTRAPLVATARSYTIKQNEPLPQFEVDYSGFKVGDTKSVLTTQPVVTCNVPADKAPGQYPITVSGATAQNYNISFVAGVLTINEADPITIRATSLTKGYGDAMPQLAYTVEGGSVTGQPVLQCDATAASPVGTYAIKVTKGTIDYPNLVLVDAVLTIAKAPLTISAGGPYTMKQTDPRPEFKPVFQGFKLGENEQVLIAQPVLTTNAPADNTPGTYEVTVSGAQAANYAITYKSGRLVITEADLITIMANDAAMVYGDEVPQLTFTITGGEVAGMPEISCVATSQSDAGTYDIVVSKGNINYPNLKLVNGKLTIGQAPLKASVGSYSRKQGEPNPVFDIVYDGFRNGDTEEVFITKPVATTDADASSAPGVYDIVVSGGEARNYAFTYLPGRLVITEADQIVIMAHAATMVYGDEVPQLTYTISGGEVEGVPELSCVATSLSDAGTYDIIVSKGTINYPNLKLVDGTLTITQAPLTASVGSYTRQQGEENPVFEILYDGFRNGDTEEVFITKPVATTAADADARPGVYDIIVSGGEARNYAFTYVSGKLTVQVPNAISHISFSAPVDIYTTTGRLVRRQAVSTEGLPRGIYIAGGRKVVVKQ